MNAPHGYGVVPDMPADAYHAIPALSASGIKRMLRSPQHFYRLTLDPQRPVATPSDAMRLGTLAHCAILEPDQIANRYAVRPPGMTFVTKEGKAWRDALPAGIQHITVDELDAALAQSDALRNLPDVAALLSKGNAEQSAFWVDPTTDVLCKCRPDWVSPAGDNGVVLLDVKTAQDASATGFAKAIANFGYHNQAAHYADGFALASGQQVLGFVFAVVESSFPFAAAAYMLDDESMAKARAVNRRITDLYAACKRSNEWPGYPQSIEPIALPRWAT